MTRDELSPPTESYGLGNRIHARFAEIAGDDLPLLVVRDREQAGRPLSVPDAQIAAVGRSLGARPATRNVKDFAQTGVSLIDPWNPPQGKQDPGPVR